MIKFQERLKKLRIENGLKQSELAEKVGVSKVTVSLWENGHRVPEMKALKKLSELFDVSIPYLTGEAYLRSVDETEEQDRAYWLESEEFLEHMFEKIARLSDDSRLIIQEMANRFYVADETTGVLKPEGVVSVKVTIHENE